MCIKVQLQLGTCCVAPTATICCTHMRLPLTNCLFTGKPLPFKGIPAGKLPSTLVTYYWGEVTMVVFHVGLYNVKLITSISTFFCWILCIHVHTVMKKSLQVYCPDMFSSNPLCAELRATVDASIETT